uniref:Uncharacterized protein n=1 Tax=Anopheles quadriannulatus TaxID=34691 RepID=A0A182XT77_ANOQN
MHGPLLACRILPKDARN